MSILSIDELRARAPITDVKPDHIPDWFRNAVTSKRTIVLVRSTHLHLEVNLKEIKDCFRGYITAETHRSFTLGNGTNVKGFTEQEVRDGSLQGITYNEVW